MQHHTVHSDKVGPVILEHHAGVMLLNKMIKNKVSHLMSEYRQHGRRLGLIQRYRKWRNELATEPATNLPVVNPHLRDIEPFAEKLRERPNCFAAELDPREPYE